MPMPAGGPWDAEGRRPVVAVVGGGIAGLAAAFELTGGAAGPGPTTPHVVVLEASDRPGGKLRTEQFAGRAVDVGPDAFLGRRPEAAELCRDIGLGGALVPIVTSGAAVFARGRPRRLPKALAMGLPTRFWPAARSGILGPAGSARLLLDVVAPRPDVRGPLGDRAIGALVARKLGRRVVDSLVDPLIGGIHAGSVADMSAAAGFPLLLAAARRRGGLMRALRRAAAVAPEAGDRSENAAPTFWAVEGGMGTVVDRLSATLADRGVEIRTASPVSSLERGDRPVLWGIGTPAGTVRADGVVLAVPAPEAARLLAPHTTEAATLLGGIDHASVAVVTLSYPPGSLPDLTGTGMLVPHGTPVLSGPRRGEPFLVTACTYLWQKWPHLDRPGDTLLRASVGRAGDDRIAALDDAALVDAVASELQVLLGTTAPPAASLVTRWPGAFPQYRVHHLLRVAAIETAVRRLPAVAVAGSAYRGVGVPACIASGRTAGLSVLDALASQPSRAGPVS